GDGYRRDAPPLLCCRAMDALRSALDALPRGPWADTALGLLVLVGVAVLVDLLARRMVLRVLLAAVSRSQWKWDDELEKAGLFRRLTRIAPTLVVQSGIGLVPGIPIETEAFVKNLAMAGTIAFAT